jgi:hypothetical protein
MRLPCFTLAVLPCPLPAPPARRRLLPALWRPAHLPQRRGRHGGARGRTRTRHCPCHRRHSERLVNVSGCGPRWCLAFLRSFLAFFSCLAFLRSCVLSFFQRVRAARESCLPCAAHCLGLARHPTRPCAWARARHTARAQSPLFVCLPARTVLRVTKHGVCLAQAKARHRSWSRRQRWTTAGGRPRRRCFPGGKEGWRVRTESSHCDRAAGGLENDAGRLGAVGRLA